MRKSVLIMASTLVLSFATPALAFDCGNSFKAAEAAITTATEAMKKMSKGVNKGLTHTLIDDAKTLLTSGKHNHKKPAAGAFDHARAVAKSRSAKAYAEAAIILASKG